MNKNWTQLSALQIGRIAEHLAQAEFMSYGFEVYDTVLDDRGIDFIARKDGRLYEVQVKAVRKYGYTFVAKSKMDICAENRLVCYMNFLDGDMPPMYIIPAAAWREPNAVLTDKEYREQKSAPEWGINFSKKNEHMLQPYLAERVMEKL